MHDMPRCHKKVPYHSKTIEFSAFEMLLRKSLEIAVNKR